jgi:hypothetical protein
VTGRKRQVPADNVDPAETGPRSPSRAGESTATTNRQRKVAAGQDGKGDTNNDKPADKDGAVEKAFIEEIQSATTTILDAFQRQFDPTHKEILDEDLRRIVERLQIPIDGHAAQAISKLRVPLRLDDLFEVVIDLTLEASDIAAVDLEIDRWVNDKRAVRYFAKNLLALQKGAKISRVYVISPQVTEAMMSEIERTLIRHLKANDNPKVKEAGGHIEIAAIYHEDLPDPKTHRDFAIFNKDIVLVEEFDSKWKTRFEGEVTKEPTEVQEDENRFVEMLSEAEGLGSAAIVKDWTARTRARIARGGFEQDVFLGYSSAAQDTATAIKEFILENKYTVRDWKKFEVGPPLLEEIDNACKECQLGLFLFTGDEMVPGKPPMPRDNVVFELGYFMSQKGDKRVIGVWEKAVEQPTDLKGNIWLELADPKNISTIENKILKWLKDQLGS